MTFAAHLVLIVTSPVEDLRKENEKLRQELHLCREECARLRALRPHNKGQKGEHYVAELIGGALTTHNARHDVVVAKSGKLLEVKWSALRYAVPGKPTKQWAWRDLLGEDGKKKYDRLILIGPMDERYRRPVDGPYVIFDIPFEVVESLPNPRYLAVGSNAIGGWSKVSKIVYQYLTTEQDMKRNYLQT